MSKSLGNTLVLHDLLEQHPPELLRYMLMKAHYTQPLDWSAASLEQARRTLDGLYTTLRDLAAVPSTTSTDLSEEFLAALADDLNTPEALAMLSRLADAARRAGDAQAQLEAKSALLSAGAFLGLLQVDPETWFQGSIADSALDEAEVQRLVDARQAAKKAKNFAEADRLRARLLELGIVVEDTPQGPRWKRVAPPKDSGTEDRDDRAA